MRSIQNLEERQTNARVQSAQVSSVTEKDIPRIKYALSLYVNVSNIVWDYASDNVKGMITSAVGEPTKMFDIDPSTSSSFDICNELWELMDWAVGGVQGEEEQREGNFNECIFTNSNWKKVPRVQVYVPLEPSVV